MNIRVVSFIGILSMFVLGLLGSCAPAKSVELLLNGEFDNEQSIGPIGSPTAYDQWVDWHVDFANNSGGWGSVYVNGDAGYGENDFKRVVCWAKGNYTLALSQQITAPKGSFEASVALLLGCGNYTTVTLKILGPDGKTVLAEVNKPQDLTNMTEEASNNNTAWQILKVPVEFTQSQDITYVVDIRLGPGGINPYIRIDDASLKGFPKP